MSVKFDPVLGALRQKDFKWSEAPASPSTDGFAGDVAYDSEYFYVAISNNTWKRTALSTWTPVTGGAGVPVGLLLSITYPS